MSINWIPVTQRVPDDRRNVLAWGYGFFMGRSGTPHLLGKTRFNPSPKGGRFDLENSNHWGSTKVTHWAEIEGPKE